MNRRRAASPDVAYCHHVSKHSVSHAWPDIRSSSRMGEHDEPPEMQPHLAALLSSLLGEQLTKQAQDRLTLPRMEMTASHPTLKQRQGLLRIIFSLSVIGPFRRAKSLLEHKGYVVYVALNEVLSAMPVGTLLGGV